MKTGLSALLFAHSLLATATAAPSISSSYMLSIRAQDSRLNGSTVVLKDESGANAFQNPLGSFSNGEPRHPYTFTVASVSAHEKLYELQTAAPPKTITRSRFLIFDGLEGTSIRAAEATRNAKGDFDGAGSWRACNGTTLDYQLYWFDGLSNLTALVGNCESVRLILEKVKPYVSSSFAPATTLCSSGYITGIPAPTVTVSGFSTKVSSSTTLATSTVLEKSPIPSSEVTIRIFNDQTGANAEAIVPADETTYDISRIFHATAIDSNGDIIGTSAQLVKFTDSTRCSLKNLNVRDWVIELDGRAKNFVDLDDTVSEAIPVWLNAFTLQCRRD